VKLEWSTHLADNGRILIPAIIRNDMREHGLGWNNRVKLIYENGFISIEPVPTKSDSKG
jgi:hypothetical protein